jgi:hypothetical protein
MAADTVVQLASNSSNCFSAVAARSSDDATALLAGVHPLASQTGRPPFGLRLTSSCRGASFSGAAQKAFATKFS